MNHFYFNFFIVLRTKIPLYVMPCSIQVIDEVHYKNHTDARCLSRYNPAIAKEKHPDANFMVAEQTFSWLSRFKSILCAMPKNYHMFYLHRLCLRRNRYTEKCNKLERRLFLPKSSDTNFIPKQ